MRPPEAMVASQQTARIAGVFDRAAETYESVGIDFFSTFGRWLVEAAALQPGERVLDVGCGRGAATIPAAEAVGTSGHVVASDLAPGMVRMLREDLAARGFHNVDVRLDDAQAPSVEQSPFDCVLVALVIFFLPKPGEALKAYGRLLTSRGRVALSTFAGDDERWSWLGQLSEFIPPERRPPGVGPRDPAEWSAERIRQLLEESAFRDVRVNDRERVTRFRDPDHWFAWSQSHGLRVIWELIPSDRLDEARGFANEQLLKLRDEDGLIPLRSVLRITTARCAP
jgi:ubiquinone/menaquinone biosynthesis C-methylase UbiE